MSRIKRTQINGRWYSKIQCNDSAELHLNLETRKEDFQQHGVTVFVDFTTNTIYFDTADRDYRNQLVREQIIKQRRWQQIAGMTYRELCAADDEEYTMRHGLEYEV